MNVSKGLSRFRKRMDLGDPNWTDDEWCRQMEAGNPLALEAGERVQPETVTARSRPSRRATATRRIEPLHPSRIREATALLDRVFGKAPRGRVTITRTVRIAPSLGRRPR